MELNEELVKKVEELGHDLSKITGLGELVKLLPKNYYFCEQRLWVGNTHVDANNYDYSNATLSMIIKLSKQEN